VSVRFPEDDEMEPKHNDVIKTHVVICIENSESLETDTTININT
jgi:hypothetical protein